VLLDGYDPPAPETALTARFGEGIRLAGYTLSGDASPGATLTLDLHWRARAGMDADWTVTVQLIGPDGALVDQDDGMPPGYPTSLWVRDTVYVDRRTLDVPSDAAGPFRVLVGWYRALDDGGSVRLGAAADGATVENDLVVLATVGE
jgi:hypothetical protein